MPWWNAGYYRMNPGHLPPSAYVGGLAAPIPERRCVDPEFVDRPHCRGQHPTPLDRAVLGRRPYAGGAGLHCPELRNDCRYLPADLETAGMEAKRARLRSCVS